MPFGKLPEFELDDGRNWSSYVRLARQFILLNEIKTELRVATLVTHVGARTYQLMCDLCAPKHPEDKTFDQLVELVTGHLEPKRSEIAERHMFRQRRQAEGESVSIFLQSLKHLATHCNFESTLEVNLRDQLVSGLRSEDMRSRLFAESSLDYKKAVELALALEAAERHAVEAVAGAALSATAGISGLGQGAAVAGLHRVAQGPPPPAAREPRGACWRCGKTRHSPNKCRYKSYVCDKCNVKGHLSVMCSKNRKDPPKSRYQNFINNDSSSDSVSSDGLYQVVSVKSDSKDGPYHYTLSIEGKKVLFEIDTGSRISAVSKSFYDKHLSHIPITSDSNKFHSYTGEAIVPLGRVMVMVQCRDETVSLPLFIVNNGGPPLLGRRWLRKLKLNSFSLHHLSAENDPKVVKLKLDFPDVFKSGLGSCKTKLKLFLKDDTPMFCKARPLPLALRDPVEQELERLQREQVIFKVDRSDYGTPIVPVIKRDGSIRLCGDYKITLNKVLKDFHYPLPRIEQLFAALSGGEQYSKIDLKHAYLQCNLEESSQPLTAITTHTGTFVYRRAPFGLKCLPEMFQKLIEETLSGLNCVAFQDDICVTGATKEIHLANLRAVLSRLQEAGLRVKFEKCEFFKEEVCYLGYRINKHGLHTDRSKVDAIAKAPNPQNVSQLRAALGLINYYARFIPNMSTLLQPLYSLLKKGTSWQWTRECEAAFRSVKEALTREPALAHYDASLPLVLAVDSSSYGLGAVLSHAYPDGSERVVCCASRTLSDTERRYSQVDKEALAIVYGVSRHHQYVYGRHFILKTDHMALSYIFGPKKGIPQTAASRLQRYAVRLAAYDFEIKFVPTERNGNADALSRLPLHHHKVESDQDDAAYLHFVEDSFPISHRDVAKETKNDLVLRKIYGYLISGWPMETEIENEKPYLQRRDSLYIDHDCIVWGYRVVVPTSLRAQILDEIHSGHPGVVRMKQVARSYVWWPLLDADIETRARACAACAAVRDAPPHAPPVPYAWPAEPWSRLHADFLHFKGKTYFLVIDSHSKWIEVFNMPNGTTATKVCAVLRECFARFGLPKQLVTDGGPPFTSEEFGKFLQCNAVKHILTAAYHPSSNGAAENAVKTVKKAIKKASLEEENVDRALSKFLFQYRNTEHASTKRSPAAAMLGRRLRSRLDMLRPRTSDFVEAAQQAQVRNAGGVYREANEGDEVLTKELRPNSTIKWKPGVITQRTGAVTYKVRTEDATRTKHIDQIMPVRKSSRLSLARSVPDTVCEYDQVMDPGPAEAAFHDAVASPPPAPSPLPSTSQQSDNKGIVSDICLRPRTNKPNYKI